MNVEQTAARRTPEQLAQTVRAHLTMHTRIALPTLAEDCNAHPDDVAAIVRQLPGYTLHEITQTITEDGVTGSPI